ncbi:sensor histidine kinase [Salirhabdus sp. Marseille-P4669]|uniref:sensor histidine kinase n=1 Tax=Salirhabdus sp. Marseille-P4669 TaxID=2042310 RepID=UPI00135CEF08|nr:histidine kinase [Salirhabdus sp. Marseille-P4669]
MPILKNVLHLYIGMTGVIGAYALFLQAEQNLFLMLLCFLLVIKSVFYLTNKQFIMYVAFSIVVCLSIIYHYQDAFSMEWLLLALFLAFPLLLLNIYYIDEEERKETYEKLLSEYRILKRQTHEAERAARLEERTKIARDIHDSVGHKLTALLMRLQMLSMQEKRQEYEDLKQLASTSLEETRQAVKQLQVEEHEGLSSVLQLIRKLEAESHIHLDFTLRKGVLLAPLSNEQNVALYRVLQESLTNAMRHAHSREVKVVLALDAVGNLTFTVKNKLHLKGKFQWGFGLTNMKKRLVELNGELTVYQNDSEFVVSGILPMEADKHGL